MSTSSFSKSILDKILTGLLLTSGLFFCFTFIYTFNIPLIMKEAYNIKDGTIPTIIRWCILFGGLVLIYASFLSYQETPKNRTRNYFEYSINIILVTIFSSILYFWCFLVCISIDF